MHETYILQNEQTRENVQYWLPTDVFTLQRLQRLIGGREKKEGKKKKREREKTNKKGRNLSEYVGEKINCMAEKETNKKLHINRYIIQSIMNRSVNELTDL